jgi:hypothetical protein
MISINIKNGEFQFNKWIFSPNDTLSEIKNKFSFHEFELRLKNQEYSTYRLNISEEYIIRIFFFIESIKSIEIYPININEDNRDRVSQRILENLGGTKNYSWGEVQLIIDHKACYESIVIRYNQIET